MASCMMPALQVLMYLSVCACISTLPFSVQQVSACVQRDPLQVSTAMCLWRPQCLQ